MSDKNGEIYELIKEIDDFCIKNFECNWQAWRYADFRNHENVNDTFDEFLRQLQAAEEDNRILREAVEYALTTIDSWSDISNTLMEALEKVKRGEG